MNNNMLNLALELVGKVQTNQVNREGVPLVEHAMAIAGTVKSVNEKIVAVLHDACEDNSITLEQLREQGFTNKIITAVETIIPREDESYYYYITRVRKNKLARAVKIADLAYSGDLSRVKNPNGRDFKRAKEYAAMKRDIESVGSKRVIESPFDLSGNIQVTTGTLSSNNIDKFGNIKN